VTAGLLGACSLLGCCALAFDGSSLVLLSGIFDLFHKDRAMSASMSPELFFGTSQSLRGNVAELAFQPALVTIDPAQPVVDVAACDKDKVVNFRRCLGRLRTCRRRTVKAKQKPNAAEHGGEHEVVLRPLSSNPIVSCSHFAPRRYG
jgi:hypothetical protein